jgi:hypothetical protein
MIAAHKVSAIEYFSRWARNPAPPSNLTNLARRECRSELLQRTAPLRRSSLKRSPLRRYAGGRRQIEGFSRLMRHHGGRSNRRRGPPTSCLPRRDTMKTPSPAKAECSVSLGHRFKETTDESLETERSEALR